MDNNPDWVLKNIVKVHKTQIYLINPMHINFMNRSRPLHLWLQGAVWKLAAKYRTSTWLHLLKWNKIARAEANPLRRGMGDIFGKGEDNYAGPGQMIKCRVSWTPTEGHSRRRYSTSKGANQVFHCFQSVWWGHLEGKARIPFFHWLN